MAKEKPADVEGSWDTTSGLADDFDFYVKKSRFGYRKEYQDGTAPLLLWEGDSPDIDLPEDFVIIWPCGKGWEVVAEGKRVEHEKRIKFIDISIYGRLITRVTKELKVNMKQYGPATDATVWEGLGFHMKREMLEFGSGILEDKGGKTEHLMPVASLGYIGERKVEKKTARAETKVEAKAEVAQLKDLVVLKLSLLAAKLPLLEFQKKALDIEGVDGEIQADVLDDEPTGFWGRHQKKA